MRRYSLLFSLVIFFSACQEKKKLTLYHLLPPERTNINFINNIDDESDLDFINYAYVYNGGGVAAGDLNNDGLTDLFFTGNQVKDRLYLNLGNLEFKDITDSSGIINEGGWTTGVTMADVDGDGYLDIYICRAGLDSTNRENMLFINNHDLTFTEKAREYGLNDNSLSIHANFFDYDNDGDLDVYIVNHPDDFVHQTNIFFMLDSLNFNNGADLLMRNDGDRFTNVSRQAGIVKNVGYGLSASTSDVNDDGWTDLFVANDFFSTDLIYINNQNGTFTEKSKEYFTKTSLFSMGSDFGDINNDGLMDLMVADMKPEDQLRLKKNHVSVPQQYMSSLHRMLHPSQYITNTLHFANGQGPYSEISELAGVARTDWSWSVLIQDFDNDGFNDIYISNGTKRDMHDLDFMMLMDDPETDRTYQNKSEDLIKKMPSTVLPNYIYKNNGNLSFSKENSNWGVDQLATSSGAVYADLDNDGDLDLVVNNTDIPAFLYENKTNELMKRNYLRVRLHGNTKNTYGINSKVVIHYSSKFQAKELSTARGYQSSPEPILHFGLDTISILDSVVVLWPGGNKQVVINVAANQTLDLYQKQASPYQIAPSDSATFFTSYHIKGLEYKHQESDFNDFQRDKLMHCQLSKEGPGIAVGDANEDGRDDIFVGGAAGVTGKLFFQQDDGSFILSKNQPWDSEPEFEDMGALLLDFNNDGLTDLYIASGSNEFEKASPYLRDRLFINKGNGSFSEQPDLLPSMPTSSSCVVAADYDKDGDMDLFIGGRLIPGKYPLTPQSFLLQNENGKFTDITSTIKGLGDCGMVTAALWSDFDNDSWQDLIVVGEWMPVTCFKNRNGHLENITNTTGLKNSTGWWKSINGGDFDNDGDIDYILGNNGLNSIFKASAKEPVEIYVNDFDNNGSLDPILFHYLNGKEAPFVDRNLFCEKMPDYNNRLFTYAIYANTPKEKLFTKEQIKNSKIFKAENLVSSYLKNNGNGTFELSPLPNEAQEAPLYGTLIQDFNDDGNLDVLITGNSYSMHYTLGNADALRGLLLTGDGRGDFHAVSLAKSGIYNNYDGKSLAMIHIQNANSDAILFGNNNDSLKIYLWNMSKTPVNINTKDVYAIISFNNGKKRKVEFYNGCGYLSQSSEILTVGDNTETVEIFNRSGSGTIRFDKTSQASN